MTSKRTIRQSGIPGRGQFEEQSAKISLSERLLALRSTLRSEPLLQLIGEAEAMKSECM